MIARRLSIAVLVACLCVGKAHAIIDTVTYQAIDEVPIARLLANLSANPKSLSSAEQARAVGRLHLLAYARQSERLPVYRGRQRRWMVAEGTITQCPGRISALPAKCVANPSNLPVQREVPTPSGLPLGQSTHLAPALEAYSRARVLEPGNMRTRLAYAYLLDRSGRHDEALDELRLIIRHGLHTPERNRFTNNLSDPAVYMEAIEHLHALSTGREDLELIAELAPDLPDYWPLAVMTPILVPLENGARFEDLVDRKAKAAFDFSAQGLPATAGWLTPRAAWLVWDPRGSGKIANGAQLFGSVTWLSFWDNGFAPLSLLDDNGDDRLTGAELKGLALWRDSDGDGVSQPGEVTPLAEANVITVRFRHQRVREGLWTAPDGVTFADGSTRPIYDWIVGR